MEYIDALELILENRESLPKPKFNLFDWVIRKDESRDFGIVTGYYYDKKYNIHGDMYGVKEITISYYIVYDKNSPCREIHSISGEVAFESEIEKMKPNEI